MKRNVFVPTRNALLLSETIAEILARRSGAARFAVVSGPAGTGKSTVARNAAKQSGGICFSVRETETARSLYSGIVNALNGGVIVELHSTQKLFERLVANLESAGWPPLLLDEADRLDRTRGGISLLEATRDIHDFTGSPIVLFSIGHLARAGESRRRLSRSVRNPRRHADSIERADLSDAQLLAQNLLEDLQLDLDLLEYCVSVSGGSYRPMLAMFEEIERSAKAAGIRSLGLVKWRQLFGFAGLPAGAESLRLPNAKTAKIAAAG